MFIKCWTSDEWSAVVWRFILLTCVLYIFQFWPGRDTAEYGGNMGPSGKSQIRRDNSPHNTHHLSRENLCLTRSASSLLWVGNLYLLFSAFKSLYILRRGNLTPPGPASSSSSTCLVLRKDWFAWRLIDEVERLTFRL